MTDNNPIEGLKLDRVHHAAITVDDIAAAVEWYSANFKCLVSFQDTTWAMLDFDNIQLALVTPGQHPAHIAFERPDAAKWGELKDHRDGTRSTYANDSSGNPVEILESHIVD